MKPFLFWKSFFCGTFRGTNELYVCISSMVVLVSIASYGPHLDRSTVYSKSPHSQLQPAHNSKNFTTYHPRAHICYTNDPGLFKSLRRLPNSFAASISDNDFAFVLLDFDTGKIFKMNFHNNADSNCVTNENVGFIHHCCAYSPHRNESNRQEVNKYSTYSYSRHELEDNFIRIEDLVGGKPLFVHQSINVGLAVNDVNVTITVQHRCRGDVTLDPYPEIHITTQQTTLNHKTINKSFHWYL